mmetsp:Transcript_7470/g.12405  ORF Transcript_7470/g.12405 Transcript_7470/m.12405 type:complete len:120 (+) Transcript_7470:1644-2003(+)
MRRQLPASVGKALVLGTQVDLLLEGKQWLNSEIGSSINNNNNNNNDDDVALTKDMNDLQVADTEVTNDVVATPIPAARPVSPEEEADVDAEIAPIVPKKLSMQDRMMRVQNIGVSSFNT